MSQRNQAINETVGNGSTGGGAAAPSASGTIKSLGVLPAGTYRVNVVTMNAGTAETTAAGLVNMALRKGTTIVGNLLSTGQPATQVFERVTVDGAQSIQVVAVAAATAGSMYLASLTATRVA